MAHIGTNNSQYKKVLEELVADVAKTGWGEPDIRPGTHWTTLQFTLEFGDEET